MQRGGKVRPVAKGELTNGKDLSGATAGMRAFFIGGEKSGGLAALSNCIPTFAEGERWDGWEKWRMRRSVKGGKPWAGGSKRQNLLSDLVEILRKSQPDFPQELYFYDRSTLGPPNVNRTVKEIPHKSDV